MKKVSIHIMLILFVFGISLTKTNAQCVQCEGGSTPGIAASTIGTSNVASGDNAFAGGLNSIAAGFNSMAFGNTARATGPYAYAIGPAAHALSNSFAIGKYVSAAAYETFVIGSGANETDSLTNNVNNSIMLGMGSNLPTLFIGGAPGMGYTGRVGIGNVSEPMAKLHIRADNTETAALLIEPAVASESSYLWLGSNEFGLKQTASRLEFLSNDKYIFNNGNIGVGTFTPAAKIHVKDGDIFIEDINHGIIMKSPDGNCWRGTLDNSGQLHFTQIDCDQLTAVADDQNQMQDQQISVYPNPAGERVYISLKNTGTKTRLTVTAANGQQMLSTKLSNTESMIDLSEYARGMYLFKFTNGDGAVVATRKIIKE